jgi:hypothetical protein
LPRAPQTPLPPVAQEALPEPEQVSAPVQGIRHEVSACTQLCYLLFNKPFLIRQSFSLRIKLHHHKAHLW